MCPSRPRKRRRRLRRLLIVIALFLFAQFWILPERVTITSVESAPAALEADLPWQLTLVNRAHGLPDGYRFSLARTRDGMQVDRRIASALEEMLDDAEALGYEIHLNAGYRTTAEQQALFDDKVASYVSTGYDTTTAQTLAAQWVSQPGTSEHELGLAVDIGTETLALYDWLAAESWRYGFIRRYPPDKTALTGVSHEPWHFRYVGEEAAAEMHAQNLCLEEYVAQRLP